MEIRDLIREMNKDVLSVCQHLLPNGKEESRNWCVGSPDGEEGRSLRIQLSGDKAGRWADFAGRSSGDLIDLWMAVRKSDLQTAIKESKEFLRIHEPEFMASSNKTFKKPEFSGHTSPTTELLSYMRGRGISEETLKAYRVASKGDKIVFPFFKDELTLVKTLGLYRPNGDKVVWVTPECKPVLFGWQAIGNARSIVITEGEIDAMTWFEMGVPALSVPFGGGSKNKQAWIEHEYEDLERFDTIYVNMDNDEVGKEATTEIVTRLGRHRCKIISLPFKDANNCLTSGWGRDDFANAIKTAEVLDPVELKRPSSYTEEVERTFYPLESDAKSYSPLWTGAYGKVNFFPSNLIVWTGINGHGKTIMLNQAAVLDGIEQGKKCCVFSLEMPPSDLLNWTVSQATGLEIPPPSVIQDTLRWLDGRLWIFDWLLYYSQTKQYRLPVDKALEFCEYAVKRFGVDVFVLDSLLKFDVKKEDYEAQKNFMNALKAFAGRFKVVVHLVAHPRKADTEYDAITKMDVGGASEITDLADDVAIVRRHIKKEDALAADEIDGKKLDDQTRLALENSPDTYLLTRKGRNRNNPRATVGLWFDKGSLQFLNSKNETPRIYTRTDF